MRIQIRDNKDRLLYSPVYNAWLERDLLDLVRQEEIPWYHPLKRKRREFMIQEMQRVIGELRNMTIQHTTGDPEVIEDLTGSAEPRRD